MQHIRDNIPLQRLHRSNTTPTSPQGQSSRVAPSHIEALPYSTDTSSKDTDGNSIPGQTVAKIVEDFSTDLNKHINLFAERENQEQSGSTVSDLRKIYTKMNDTATRLKNKCSAPSTSQAGTGNQLNHKYDTPTKPMLNSDMAFLSIVLDLVGIDLKAKATSPELKELADTAIELSIFMTAKAATGLHHEIRDEIFKNNDYIQNPGASNVTSGSLNLGATIGLINAPKIEVESPNPKNIHGNSVAGILKGLATAFPELSINPSISGEVAKTLSASPDGEIGYITTVQVSGSLSAKAKLLELLDLNIGITGSELHSTKVESTSMYYGSLVNFAEQEAFINEGSYLTTTQHETKLPKRIENRAIQSSLKDHTAPSTSSSQIGETDPLLPSSRSSKRKLSSFTNLFKQGPQEDAFLTLNKRSESITKRHGDKPQSLNTVLQTAMNHEEDLLSKLKLLGHKPD